MQHLSIPRVSVCPWCLDFARLSPLLPLSPQRGADPGRARPGHRLRVPANEARPFRPPLAPIHTDAHAAVSAQRAQISTAIGVSTSNSCEMVEHRVQSEAAGVSGWACRSCRGALCPWAAVQWMGSMDGMEGVRCRRVLQHASAGCESRLPSALCPAHSGGVSRCVERNVRRSG